MDQDGRRKPRAACKPRAAREELVDLRAGVDHGLGAGRTTPGRSMWCDICHGGAHETDLDQVRPLTNKRLWMALGVILLVSFAVLGMGGARLISGAPPIP